jgi:hypothetical protein
MARQAYKHSVVDGYSQQSFVTGIQLPEKIAEVEVRGKKE